MTGRRRLRLALAGLTVIPLAACGTTVAGVEGTGSNGGGLSAPAASAPTVMSSAAAPPGASAAPGTESSGAVGSVGPAAGTGSTASSGSASSGTLAGGGSGTTSSVQAGDGPGVTPTTIYVAAAYEPDTAAADAALGVANANPGDTKAEQQAVFNYINAHGGIAHRKVVPVWYKASVTQSSATTDQQSCNTWTQDNKTFVVASGTPIWDQCTANEHGIAVQAGAIVLETSAQNRKYPEDINLTSFTIDHAMTVTINGLARQNYFGNGAKVGIVTWDDPYYRYGISTAANPDLARLGLHNVPVEYVAVPQSYGDLGATSASANSAVLRFRSLGINHVILFDGGAGINSSGVLVLEFMQQANSQHYYPKYGLNSTSGFNGLASDYPQRELVGSVGVGWQPALEQTQQEYDASPKPATAKLCLKIMKDAGQQQSGANAQGLQFSYCDAMFFLKQVLDPITGPLNQQTALAAINKVGTGFTSSVTFGVDITSSKHDGGYLVRNMDYFTSCKCFRYTSKPYNPYAD